MTINPNSSLTSDTKITLLDKLRTVKNQIKEDPISWSIILLITTFFTFFMIIPLLTVIIEAFYQDGKFPLETYIGFFNRKSNWDPGRTLDTGLIRIIGPEAGINYTTIELKGPDFGVFLNTIFIGVVSTLVSLIIGIFTALLMARVEFPGKSILGGLLLVPLVLPPFVSGVGFVSLLGREGLINNYFLVPNFNLKIVLRGVFAIVLVQSAHYFTLIYLNVYSSLMNADPSLEEAAENMGASRLQVLKNVTLPLALPGIASGSILVLILSMEDLGTPVIFASQGDTLAQKTITYRIFNEVRRTAGDSSELPVELAILSAFLLVVSIIGFFFIRKFTEKRQYSMISKGRAGSFRTISTGIFSKIVIYGYFVVLLVVSLIPHIGVFLVSTTDPGDDSFLFSLESYKQIFDFTGESGFFIFIRNTLVYSFTATGVIVVLATLAGYVANRKRFTGRAAFDTLITIPLAIPGVVLGIGYFLFLGSFQGRFRGLNPYINPIFILIIAYTVRKFPFTVRAVYAGLQQTDEVLEEAAHNMGASKVKTVWNVVIPLIILNIVAGALISLVYNMSEVSTTLLLISSSNEGTVTWAMEDQGGEGLAIVAAMGMILMFLQAISLIVTNLLLKDRAEAITGI